MSRLLSRSSHVQPPAAGSFHTAAATTLPPGSWKNAAPARPQDAESQDRFAEHRLIGCGADGPGDARNASRFGKVVALCDVDENNLNKAATTWPAAEKFRDFRKVMDQKTVDVVIWDGRSLAHSSRLAAMRAQKDVLREAPTLTIDEGSGSSPSRRRRSGSSRPGASSGGPELPPRLRARPQRPDRQGQGSGRLAPGRSEGRAVQGRPIPKTSTGTCGRGRRRRSRTCRSGRTSRSVTGGSTAAGR